MLGLACCAQTMFAMNCDSPDSITKNLPHISCHRVHGVGKRFEKSFLKLELPYAQCVCCALFQ
jgi:hypothetical protein